MARELMEAARAGDISELYRLIRQDPYVLERFDDIPFVDTPLHAAASAGNTPVAIEIARLKPSFGRKLNQDGLSPIHLALGCKNDPALECEDDPALECKHDQTVRKLINLDRELICVQGKEGFTPLHRVTERQNLDLLATFLFNCPTSIEKLTNRGETAVHIAVKNQNFGAFEILLAWLHAWADMKEILELKDDEGNTVLHIAAKTNQHQVAELLVDKVNIYARNSDGLTARDLLLQLSSQQNISKFKKNLSNKRAKRALSLPKDETLVEILRPKLPFYERWERFVFRMKRELTSSMRENLIVVAVLIVTATYQAALQPPGGFRQVSDNNSNLLNCTPYNTTIMESQSSEVGRKTVMDKSNFFWFSFLNTTSFFASIGMICILLPVKPYSLLLILSLSFLSISFSYTMVFISPPNKTIISIITSKKNIISIIVSLYFIFLIAINVGPLAYKKGKNKIRRALLARGDGTWQHYLRWRNREI